MCKSVTLLSSNLCTPRIGALMETPVMRWLYQPDGTTGRVIANEPYVL